MFIKYFLKIIKGEFIKKYFGITVSMVSLLIKHQVLKKKVPIYHASVTLNPCPLPHPGTVPDLAQV